MTGYVAVKSSVAIRIGVALSCLACGMHSLQAQTDGSASSLDGMSTTDVIIRTLMFLAVLVIAHWLARRLK